MNADEFFDLLNQKFGSGVDTSKSIFGPFQDVVGRYQEEKIDFPRLDLRKRGELFSAICPNGFPAVYLVERQLNWCQGIGSFCRPSSAGAIGEIAQCHSEALTDLYGVWSDLEDEITWDSNVDKSSAVSRGAYLFPALLIHNRDTLSDQYINDVLKPYQRSVIECRKMFFQRIREAHSSGVWLGLQPRDDGKYSMMLPASGFDQEGNYHIARSEYIKGFQYNDEEVDVANYPRVNSPANHDHWVFLSADEVPEFCFPSGSGVEAQIQLRPVSTVKPTETNTFENSRVIGRPRGTGLKEVERQYLDEIISLIKNDSSPNKTQIILSVYRKHEDKILGEEQTVKNRYYRWLREEGC